MDCLSPEQMAAYVRGGGADPRAVEDHVRGCPGCAMELLLVRETLAEPRAKAVRPPTDRLRAVSRQEKNLWIPWAVAASVLLAAIFFAVTSSPTPAPPVAVKTPDPVKPKPPAPMPPEAPRPPGPAPKPPVPLPVPDAPKPAPESRPEPVPEKTPEPVKPPPPPAPKPEPEPSKPAPTLVERAVVARVIHSVGSTASPVGRVLRAGETLVTARQEFVAVALEGYGRLYFRENSHADLGASGDVTLHEGEMLARADPGKRLGSVKLPVVQVEPLAPMFSIAATKISAEISILSGKVTVGEATAKGPVTMLIKAGKAPEQRPLDAGFAAWVPDKLAAKRFTGWYEAEDFASLQGFRVQPHENSSGGKAAVQIADAGGIAMKTGLPFKGRHVVWIRARQYEAKAVVLGVHLNGQAVPEVKLEGAEGKPWRWVGPLVVNSDRLDLGLAALSRWPFKEGDERRSFPVVVDAVVVSSDVKYVPPDRLPEEGRGLDLALDEPPGK